MNWALIISIAVLAVICNVIMDEIRFRWSRLFGMIIRSDSALDHWMNPSKSWTNKYIPESAVLQFIFGTALVWITDLWHLLKAMVINCVFLIFLLLIKTNETVWIWLAGLLFLNIAWGFVFEFTAGILGAISDKLNKDLHKRE